MGNIARKRRDRRAEATRIALIEAAESLFADAGFKAVSMRQIGATIGSANNNVVAYHFGSKTDLIEAIYNHRLPAIDARRRELFDVARQQGTPNLHELLRIMWQPLFEQVDQQGRHSYGRFLHALMRDGMASTRVLVNAQFPTSTQIWTMIVQLLGLCETQPMEDIALLSLCPLLEALRLIDEREDETANQQLFEDALTMMSASLNALADKMKERI